MRIITLTQPWASAVAWGLKLIETRSWYVTYRGPLAIHAAQGLGPAGGEAGLLRLCQEIPALRQAFRERNLMVGGIPHVSMLPRGAVVAVAELAGCWSTDMLNTAAREAYPIAERVPRAGGEETQEWMLTEQERSLGLFTPARYGWLLADVQELLFPIAWRGGQGIRQVSAEQAETFLRYTRPAGHFPMRRAEP